MKIFVSLPDEILSENSDSYWKFWKSKVQKEYPNATIWSNYEGNGSIESADAVLFFYDYKETEGCKRDMELCRRFNKPYNFLTRVYVPSSNQYSYE